MELKWALILMVSVHLIGVLLLIAFITGLAKSEVDAWNSRERSEAWDGPKYKSRGSKP